MPVIEYETTPGQSKRVSVAKAVEGFILNIYSDGAVERVQDRIEHAAEMIGVLIELLHGKGLIEDSDLSLWMPGHRVVS